VNGSIYAKVRTILTHPRKERREILVSKPLFKNKKSPLPSSKGTMTLMMIQKMMMLLEVLWTLIARMIM